MDKEGHLHRFGTPLAPLEKDKLSTKKPIALEDQIVKDENGKRRFHGAFTGGFSAGFWNTVGSLEGWTPQHFKSSRGEKANKVEQKPEDFMDKEDLGEFGIAPQGIRTRDEFTNEREVKRYSSGQRKRKIMQSHAAVPIPRVSVLEHMLHTIRDKVAVRILKHMGWKPGQGVGPRQTPKQKHQSTARIKRKKYLLELELNEAEGLPILNNSDNDESDEEKQMELENITFAPNDYEPIFYESKNNRFGISYSGLSRAPVLSKGSRSGAHVQHINLFEQSKMEANQKQFSIRGQAFGVGAFEEEDDDIYAKDDMTKYDFCLSGKQPRQTKVLHLQQQHVIDGFSEDISSKNQTSQYIINLALDFQPRNWLMRRSRFAPMIAESTHKLAQATELKKISLGRHDLNPEQRAQLVCDSKAQKNPFKSNSCTISHNSSISILELSNGKSNHFTKDGLIISTAEKHSVTTVERNKNWQQSGDVLMEKGALNNFKFAPATTVSGFKPFLADKDKQKRYERFLIARLSNEMELTAFLADLQPVTFSLWDREMEKREFIQASKIYKPLAGLMLNRFVSETTVQPQKIQERAQAILKRKITAERTKTMWKPNVLLCKRYNIAEPFERTLPEAEKELNKPKMSIFDYLETSINTKDHFQTPSIIPKYIERTKTQSAAVRKQITVVEKDKSLPAKTNQSVSSYPLKLTSGAKTPLEQAVDSTRDKPISEKADLFKRIFDVSDEETVPSTIEDQQPADDKHTCLLPSSATTAAAESFLHNSSPPRGIFSTLFKPAEVQFSKPTDPVLVKYVPVEGCKMKIFFKSRKDRLKNEKEVETAEVPTDDLYGPQLPSQIIQMPIDSSVQAESKIDVQLLKLHEQHENTKNKMEQWVERTITSADDTDEDSSASSKTCFKKSNAKKMCSYNKFRHKEKKKSKKSHKSKHKLKKKKIKAK